MAGYPFVVKLHKKDGTTHSLNKSEVIDNGTITIQNILDGSYCISIGCTALSQTSGGAALSGSTQVYAADQGTFISDLYDVTPEPEPPVYDLVKIMHNGDTYNIADTRCDGIEDLLAEI